MQILGGVVNKSLQIYDKWQEIPVWTRVAGRYFGMAAWASTWAAADSDRRHRGQKPSTQLLVLKFPPICMGTLCFQWTNMCVESLQVRDVCLPMDTTIAQAGTNEFVMLRKNSKFQLIKDRLNSRYPLSLFKYHCFLVWLLRIHHFLLGFCSVLAHVWS